MKMSKKYKALLLSAVLMTLGGNAFATYEYGKTTYDSLWNVGSEDTTFTDWELTVDPNDKVGRSDGKTLTFEGGSISGSAQMFEASGDSTINFGTEEKPLTSFHVEKGSDDYATVGYIYGVKSNSVVRIYAEKYEQEETGAGLLVQNKGQLYVKVKNFTATTVGNGDGISAKNGGQVEIQADEFTSTSGGYGIDSYEPNSSVKINAGTVNITSTGEDCPVIHAYGNAASVNITANTIKLESTDDTGIGVGAARESQVNLTGDTTIVAPTAIEVWGGSTVNINTVDTKGTHTTVIDGDIVFGNMFGFNVNADVNVNLTGSDSSWTGSAYNRGDDDVTGFDLTIANGAAWNMTGDSFVNTATLTNGGAINVGEDVETFNADKITMTGGVFDAKGGTSTISTLNADGNSTISLSNAALVARAGTIALKELNASGTSSFASANAVTAGKVSVAEGGNFTITGGATITGDLAAEGADVTLAAPKGATGVAYSAGGSVTAGNLTVNDSILTLGGGADASYIISGNITTNTAGKVILSSGKLTKDDIGTTLNGNLEISGTGILSTLSSQIYTNAASETEKDSGAVANKNITFTGGTLDLTDAKYTLNYLESAKTALAKVGKTTLLMSGELVNEETGESTGQVSLDTIIEAEVGSDVVLDKVDAVIKENNLLVGTKADITSQDKEVDGIKVEKQVESLAGLRSLEITEKTDTTAGVVITNNQNVTLGGSEGGTIIKVVNDEGVALEEQPDVKVVIGTTTAVADDVATAGTLTIGNAKATSTTEYKLNGDAVLNSGSTLNVNGQTEITKSVTLNEGTVAVKEGSKLTTAALDVKAVGNNTSASTLTGAAEVTKVTIDDKAVLNIGNKDNAGELVVGDIVGGIVFLDPAWTDGSKIEDASGLSIGKDATGDVTINTALVVGNHSKISVGAELSSAEEAFGRTGLTWGKDVTAAAYIGKNATLESTKGSLTIDGSITDDNFSNKVGTPTAGKLTIAKESLLMVDGSAVTEKAALSGVTSTSIDAGSKLYVDNAKKGETYKILAGTIGTDFWGENGDIISSNSLLKLTKTSDSSATQLNVGTSVQSAKTVYGNDVIAPDVIDKATAGDSALNDFIMDKAVQSGVNSTKAAQVSALNSAMELSELAGAARGAYTTAGLVNDAVADHMSIVHEYTHDKDVWAKYIHNKDDVDGLSIAGKDVSYKNKYNGIVVGADLYHNEKATVGLALTYGDGDITGSTLSAYTKNDAKYYGATIYGGIHNGDTAFLGDISYLHSKNDITQTNSGETITGTEKSKAFSIGVRAEQSVKAGEGQFVPYVGLRYMHLSNGSYTDSLGLSHDGGDMNLWLLPVGVKYSMDAKNGSWTLRPIAEIGYVWNMGDRDARETVSFDGTSNSFGYDVTDNGSFLGHLGFEAEKGNTTFGIGYQYQKGDSMKSNRWSASVNYRF